MSRLTSLSLWGRFFRLSSTLVYKPSSGYLTTFVSRSRHPLNHNYYQHFQEEYPNGIILSSLHSDYNDTMVGRDFFMSEKVDQKLFNKVEIELGKKIQIWDFEFDVFTNINSKLSKSKKVDLQTVLHTSQLRRQFNTLDISVDAVATSLLNTPVIGDGFDILHINNIIIDAYVNKIILELDPQSELLILTGEMIWSGFIHISHISKLIQKKINRNIDIILDVRGIWRSIVYMGGSVNEILKFSEKYFKPDIRFIASQKKLSKSKGYRVFKYYKKKSIHQLVLIKDRVALYDIGGDVHDELSKDSLPPILLFSENSKNSYFELDKDRFLHWWKAPKHYVAIMSPMRLKYYPLAKHIKKTFKLDQPKNFSGKKNSKIFKGQLIGKRQKIEYDVLDYHRYGDITKYMLCINGQIVKKGEVLANIPKLAGFVTSLIKSPITGRLDLSLSKDGYIKIFFNKTWYKQYANFDGQIVDIRKDKYFKIETDAVALFSVSYIPNDHSNGVLRASKQELNADTQNILMLKHLWEFNYTADQIRDLNITGVICAHASYDDYYKFITNHNVKVSGVTLLVLSMFNEISSDSYNFLKQYLEYHVFIDDGTIYIPTQQFGDFLQSAILTEGPQYKPKECIIGKGQQVKYLTYDRSIHYAIIENIQDNLVLVNQSNNEEDKLFSVHIDNIIIAKNE